MFISEEISRYFMPYKQGEGPSQDSPNPSLPLDACISDVQKKNYSCDIETADRLAKHIRILDPAKKCDAFSLITEQAKAILFSKGKNLLKGNFSDASINMQDCLVVGAAGAIIVKSYSAMAAEAILLLKGMDLLKGPNFSSGPINIKDYVIVGVAGVIIVKSYVGNFFAASSHQRIAEKGLTCVDVFQRQLNGRNFPNNFVTNGLLQVAKAEERAFIKIKNFAVREKMFYVTAIGSSALSVLGTFSASLGATFGSAMISCGILGVLVAKVARVTLSLNVWDVFKKYENSETKALQDSDFLKDYIDYLRTLLETYQVMD